MHRFLVRHLVFAFIEPTRREVALGKEKEVVSA
jgi:hypothetical protein